MNALRLDVADGHRPVLVEARLRTGVGKDMTYSLDLAGLLAARLRRIAQADLDDQGVLVAQPLPDTTEDDAHDMDLPLSRCLGGGHHWHWLASCATHPDAAPQPDPRTFYRVIDSSWEQRAAQRPLPYTHPTGGAYRDVMMAAPVVICGSLRWHAVGDPERIADLLTPLTFIGRRRSVGEGGVLAWTVTEVPDADPARWAHLGDDGNLIRPCPVECAETLGVPYRRDVRGLRPPNHHDDRKMALAVAPEPEEDEDLW